MYQPDHNNQVKSQPASLNRAILRFGSHSLKTQTKLTIGQANDKYEQVADQNQSTVGTEKQSMI